VHTGAVFIHLYRLFLVLCCTGKLLTGGLHLLCQHPNYLGYALWRLGFGMASGSLVATVLALHNIPDFLTVAIPEKEGYMKRVYGDQYKTTGFERRAKLIPFIW
jgi:protein-S-isoprenylcysteine O-methyltransferase Ste14